MTTWDALEYVAAMDERTLAHELRRMRKAAGLTQVALAACLGVHQTYVSKAERGIERVYPDTVRKWAECCGCTVEVIFAHRDDPLDARIRRLLPRLTDKQREHLSGLLESFTPEEE